APKLLVIDGGLTTVSVSEDVLPSPASLDRIWTLLVKSPSTVPLTSTLTVQVLSAAGEALLKVKTVSPGAGLNVPPQVLLALAGFATCMLAGRLSVKLALIAAAFTVLSIEKVIVLDALTGTVLGLKVLVIDGGCRMMMPTSAVPPLEAGSPAA